MVFIKNVNAASLLEAIENDPVISQPVESTIEKITPQNDSLFSKIMRFSIGQFSMADLLQIILSIIIVALLIKYFVGFLRKILSKTKIDIGLQGFLLSMVKGVIYVIGALVILEALGFPITELVAIIGVLGLAISLSIQDFMTNLMSGLTILASKPYVIGDFIEVSDGASGIVERIGLLYTEFKSIDEKVLYIPNGLMSSGKIINYSRSSTRKIDMMIGVAYDTDIDLAKEIINTILNNDERVLPEPEPMVRLRAFGQISLDILVRFSVASSDYFSVLFDFNEELLRQFRKNNITIPLITNRDIQIKNRKAEVSHDFRECNE
ncbi:MAG: mechanosensitive ion channel family protein [Christensenellaceae bacterium]|nr:mechanosensitive ion channel family protein [Christensenellaceae bacterium]